MAKKIFPRKPFKFGKFIIEYSEYHDNPVHFLKEEINTEDEAKQAADRLKEQGYKQVLIKQIG